MKFFFKLHTASRTLYVSGEFGVQINSPKTIAKTDLELGNTCRKGRKEDELLRTRLLPLTRNHPLHPLSSRVCTCVQGLRSRQITLFTPLFSEAAVHGTETLLLKLKIVVNLIRRIFSTCGRCLTFFRCLERMLEKHIFRKQDQVELHTCLEKVSASFLYGLCPGRWAGYIPFCPDERGTEAESLEENGTNPAQG